MTRSHTTIVLRLLGALLPGHERDFVVGDLEERYREYALPIKGRLRANLWLWKESLSLTLAYLWSIIRYGKTREVDVVLEAGRFRRRSRFESVPDEKSSLSDRFRQHLRNSLRRVHQNPAFTMVVVLILAIGIGANVAIFSLVNAILIRPLPYPESGRLVTINHFYPSINLVSSVSVRGFLEYRDTISSFEQVAASTGWVTNLTGIGEPERLFGRRISWDYFDVYGITPTMGRTFQQDEDVDGNNNVVILSDGFWKSRFGAAPDVVGRTIRLNSESYTIVGVMPEGFRDFFGVTSSLWTPLALTPDQLGNRSIIFEWLRVVARLKDGVSIESARAEMEAKAQIFREEAPDFLPEGWSLPVTTLNEQGRSGFRSPLLLLAAAVGIVLLLTCANVANLLLARSIRRRREIAIRRSLGASRRSLVEMLLTESVLLSGFGGIAGLVIAFWGIRAIVTFGPAAFTSAGIGIDLTVLLFTLVITILTGLLFGLAPAAQASGLDIQAVLREGGPGSGADLSGSRFRKVLVAAEFAMALILLSGAGLLIRTINGLQQIDTGFEPANILTANISLPNALYTDNASIGAFYDQLLTRMNATPGIEAAAVSSHVPFTGRGFTSIFNVEGYVPDDEHPRPWGDIRIASPGFDRAMGIPLIKGRFFMNSDGPDTQPVVVVDDVMVERFWPEEDPIGKRITFDSLDNPNATWFHVIGVIGHTHQSNLVEDTHLQVYFCSNQNANTTTNLIIRTETDPLAMASTVREVVLSIDSEQPIARIAIMEDLIAASIGNRRTTMLLLVIFAVIAVILASLGIYGVMSQMVGERTREIGVRMACGASRSGLIGMVVKHGLVLAATGSAVGLVSTLLLAGAIRSQLYGVSPFDPLTLATVTVLILFIASISTLLPAVRASLMDPVACLRAE